MLEYTDLQDLYDRFQAKIDEDLLGKEGRIFNLINSAIAKSYKYVNHKLDYVLTDEDRYEGYFVEKLGSDEIELLALWMIYEWNRKRQQKLLGQKRSIGTRDFNKLGSLSDELKSINFTMGQIMGEINALKNDFNTYKYDQKGGTNLKKNNILLQVPVTGEITLEDVCNRECRKLRSLLYLLEEEFNTKMIKHPEIRKFILDSSNFIDRIPNMVSEIVRTDTS